MWSIPYFMLGPSSIDRALSNQSFECAPKNAGRMRKQRAPLNSVVECPLSLEFYIAERQVVADYGVCQHSCRLDGSCHLTFFMMLRI